jgi:phage host-nuclease inhibitor protein Gam
MSTSQKMQKRVKTAVSPGRVPQNREDVSADIAELGVLQRERTRIQASMNDAMASIKAEYETMAEPVNEKIKTLSEGVSIWCAANRKLLTEGGKVKTHAFAAGEVRWRITPPKVVIRGAEAVLDALRRAGLTRFIRTKEEISKEAILAEPEAVAAVRGIGIEQKEEFVIVPFETQLEEVR